MTLSSLNTTVNYKDTRNRILKFTENTPEDGAVTDNGVEVTGASAASDGTASGAAPAAASGTAPNPLASAIALMTASPRHRYLFIADLEWAVMPPIALKQFRVFAKDGRPLAYPCWAFVSDEVEARLKTGQIKLKPAEWKSGDRCWLIDLVAPLGGAPAFVKLLQDSVLKDQTVSLSAAVQFAVKAEEQRGNGKEAVDAGDKEVNV